MSSPSNYSNPFSSNDTATTEIYTLSLHDALPIFVRDDQDFVVTVADTVDLERHERDAERRGDNTFNGHGLVLEFADRKSTRLNSSHGYISYAVFCLKKKK